MEKEEQLRAVFNTVRDHLLKQAVQAKDGGTCMYRGPNGTKCAVGCLIKDEHYTPEIEGLGVVTLVIGNQAPRDEMLRTALTASIGPLSSEMLNLLEELQNVHDSSPPEGWRHELSQLEAAWFPS